jgi:hypothetical protein
MKKFRNTLALSLLLTCQYNFSDAQNLQELKCNNIYIEFLGSAGMYSVNFERILAAPVKWVQISTGIGISVYNNTTYDLPLHTSILIGPRSSRLELGAGIQPEMYYYTDDASESQLIWFNRIGYRYQRRQGGFHFQCGITPVYYPKNNWKSSWFGLGLGWTF